MSDAPPTQPSAAQPPTVLPPSLPTSLVLSYIAATDSPTRVRRVASGMLLVLGILEMLLVLITINLLRFFNYDLDMVVRHAPYLLLLPLVVMLGLLHLVCWPAVRRGNSNVSTLARVSIAPVTFMVGIAGVLLGTFALLDGLGIYGHPRPAMLCLLLPAIANVLALLLLNDLSSFLSWIAHHPITERPPVPFLPGATTDNLWKGG